MTKIKTGISRVIRDSRDASKDIWIKTTAAKLLYSEGKLSEHLGLDRRHLAFVVNDATPELEDEGRYE